MNPVKMGVSEPSPALFSCYLYIIIVTPSWPVLQQQQQHASGSWPWWWHGAYAGGAVAAGAAGPWGVSPPSPKSLLASVWASWWGGSRRLWGSGRTWRGRCGRRGSSPLRWPSPGTHRDSAAASSRHQQLRKERGQRSTVSGDHELKPEVTLMFW